MLLQKLDEALNAARSTKTAGEGPMRNPSTHPTATAEDTTNFLAAWAKAHKTARTICSTALWECL